MTDNSFRLAPDRNRDRSSHLRRQPSLGVTRRYSLFWLHLVAAACTVISAQAGPPPVPWAKPYLIVEAWKDRKWVSDLYVYDLAGHEIKRLTATPLPTCHIIAVSPQGTEIAFEANAMSSYVFSLRHDALWPLHVGRTPCAAFSSDGNYTAYVGSSFLDPHEQIIRITGPQRYERKICEDIAAFYSRLVTKMFWPRYRAIIAPALG
jgi:hypothetical protein